MRTMQQVFGDLIGKCVFVYLDDILVFSKTPEEHEQHLRLVLERLKQYNLYARLPKCHFNLPEVEFLGHIVGRGGIRVDPRKVQIVKDWPTPQSQGDVRSFLGLANYFRRFIHAYSVIAKPLHALTGNVKWHPSLWNGACQQAFDLLKHKLCTAPVLAMPDFTKPFEVVADASKVAIGAILLQDGKPISFESRKLTPAECNYDTTEREMVAVIHALTVWRCYLDGMEFTVFSDHEPLKYLSTKPSLTPRQVRWSQFMERFNYKWEYRAGRLNAADPLSRAPHSSINGSGMGTITGYAVAPVHLAAIATSDKSVTYPPPPPMTEADVRRDWVEQIKEAYTADDSLVALQKRKQVVYKDGLYYHAHKQQLIYMPHSLRVKCLEELHDTPFSGHKGKAKTFHAVTRLYWWPGMAKDIASFVKTCLHCQRSKASNAKPTGLLQPLPVPQDRWSEVTMDFITGLPCTPRGYDAVMVMCDRLSKMVHFAPCHKETDTPEVAKLFIKHVFANHGLPDICISDRDTRFTSNLWQDLQQQLGTKHRLSTAFHPQTDGQTERVNRVLEEYLRSFVNSAQSDWDEWLPLAEFAYNNSWHETIGTTPFYMNYGKHPKLPSGPSGPARFPAVDTLVTTIQDVVTAAKRRLQAANDRAKRYADEHRSELKLTQGQQVMLSTKFIKLKVPGDNKLLPKYVGPFTIKEVLGDVTYRLDLPVSMKCHNVFHVSLLKPYHAGGREQPAPPPFEFDDEEGLWYEVDCALDHRHVKRGRKHVLQYLVSFKGQDASHNQWCDACGVTKLTKDEYHSRTGTTPNTAKTDKRKKRSVKQSPTVPSTSADVAPQAQHVSQIPVSKPTKSRYGRVRHKNKRFSA